MARSHSGTASDAVSCAASQPANSPGPGPMRPSSTRMRHVHRARTRRSRAGPHQVGSRRRRRSCGRRRPARGNLREAGDGPRRRPTAGRRRLVDLCGRRAGPLPLRLVAKEDRFGGVEWRGAEVVWVAVGSQHRTTRQKETHAGPQRCVVQIAQEGKESTGPGLAEQSVGLVDRYHERGGFGEDCLEALPGNGPPHRLPARGEVHRHELIELLLHGLLGRWKWVARRVQAPNRKGDEPT